MIGPKFYAWDRNGKPLAFGKLYTYQARTNEPKATYQTEDQITENTNPIILNGEGYANVYLDGSYKMVLKDKDDNEIWSSDPVTGAQANEWTNCYSATYISSTSFKVAGNQVGIYLEGRTLRINNNASEYEYTQVESAIYASGETTVTVTDAVITTGLNSVCTSIVTRQAHNSTFGRNNVGAHDEIYTRKYDNVAEATNEDEILDLVGKTIKTLSYHSGTSYGGALYRVNSALELDSEKIAAGIQIETTNPNITIELLEPNDKFVEQIGVMRSSSQDATTIMQPYIDYFKSVGDSLTLRLARWTYYLHTELDLLNIGNNNSIAIIGQGKTRINSQGTGSILYANTGRIGILVAGTENVTLEGFSIFADPNNDTLVNPSNIGLMFARTGTFNYCQFIKLNDIHISVFSNDLTDNENRGGIGLYNYASESWESDGLSIAADTPAVFTTSNVLNVNYTDRFINPSLSTFTTTNFQFNNLQLYPKGGSACLMDVVRDFEVNTLLGFADALQLKYLFEFEGDLPCRRIYVNNIHTERLGRFIRVGTPLLESKFTGKAGASNSDSGILVADNGYMNNVDFDVFFFSSGTVKIIDDRTTNESFGVTVNHSKVTNGPNVSFEFDMGTAVYANTSINSDSNVDTIHGLITASSDSTIYIYGRDGLRAFGNNFRGSVRPTTGLYDGREFYDTSLQKPIWYHGGQWVVGFAFSATTAQLQDATSAINTTDKFQYKQVTNSDTLQQVYAAATSPTSTWRDSDGNVVYTPV